MGSRNLSLLFFGSDSFSIRVLEYLIKKKLCPIEVVSKSRTLLHSFSKDNNLKCHDWPLNLRYHDDNRFNIGLVASFGHMINPEVVNKFSYGLFNIHPSLLPQYRGSTPVQAAVRDGLKITGCTIMRIPPIEKFDIGEIVLQERLAIQEGEYSYALMDRLADQGAVMVEKFLSDYDNCMKNIKIQSDQGKSYAKKLKTDDGLLKFKSDNSDVIDRKVRAFTRFIDLFTYCLGGLKVKLGQMIGPEEVETFTVDRLMHEALENKKIVIEGGIFRPGTIFFHKRRRLLCFKCSDSKWIAFENVTPDQKAPMSATDFYNGYLSKTQLLNRKTDL